MPLLADKIRSLETGGGPLYRRLEDALRDALRDQVLRPNEALPPERDLAADLSVSRITLRKALDTLVGEGLLVRRQGAELGEPQGRRDPDRIGQGRRRVEHQRPLDRVADRPSRMRGDLGERCRNGGSRRGDPDDVRLGDVRIVEQDRDHRRVGIAQQEQDLLAVVGPGQGLALPEGQRPAGGTERPLRRQ